jgi:ring-1,2-phenylacetyl-CoA epoxidase subunit PaaC
MTTVAAPADVVAYTLQLGDDALVLSQRLSEWVAHAPEIEEDIALANIALDLLGQARALYAHAGELEGSGRTEDDLAYLRDERAFANVLLVELENGDFAQTIARQLFFASYQLELYTSLEHSVDEVLAGVAAKAAKEVAYHRDHASEWTLRLGDGTDESQRRMQTAVERLWPYTGELFDGDDLVRGLAAAGVGVDPAALRPAWESYVTQLLREARLAVPEAGWEPGGGRQGLHTEAMGYLLAELQHVHRSHPGATW